MEVKFTMNVLINRERKKVIFAEVGSDLADILLSFFTLPLGTIVRLLQEHYGEQAQFGSISTLYNGLANLDYDHFWTKAGKWMLLNPRSSFEAECCKLKLNLDDTEATKYFTCAEDHCFCKSSYACMYYGIYSCYYSGKTMNREIGIRKSKTRAPDGDGVFTKKTASFVITDDLRMVPNEARSFFQTLCNFGITDTTETEQSTVTVGFNEIMDLLKGSLLSSTPLTDLILNKKKDLHTVKFEPINHVGIGENFNSKKMSLKVIVEKSTPRFLFAQAEENFIDFLLCLLTIPLGRVERLLGGNSCLSNVDNLYSSLGNSKKYLTALGTKKCLLKPELAPMYLSKNQLLSVTEQTIPDLYYKLSENQEHLSEVPNSYRPLKLMDPKGLQGSYVRGPGTYIIRDDLTVEPSRLCTRLSILDQMQVQLSDVEELELEIGSKEGLSILKASLTSPFALSNGLEKLIKKKKKNYSSLFACYS